jgi:hypothetical protein
MKKILLISAIAGGIYLAIKLNSNISALEKIKVNIKSVKNIDITNNEINLKIDLKLTNSSSHNLGLDTFNLVSVKQLRFYNSKNRLLIGTANVDISNIVLPSKETLILADIICKIPVNNLLNHLSLLSGKVSDTLSVVPVFSAGGKTFEINPENYV